MSGVILAIAAACCYAGYSVAAAEIIDQGASSRATVGALFGLASLVLVPVLAITGSAILASARGIIVAGYLALIPMSIGYLLFGHGLRRTTATAATGLSLLGPAVAAVLADLIAHQHLPAIGWLGLALVVASVLMKERLGGRSSPTRRTTCDRIGDDAGATMSACNVVGNESATTGRRREQNAPLSVAREREPTIGDTQPRRTGGPIEPVRAGDRYPSDVAKRSAQPPRAVVGE